MSTSLVRVPFNLAAALAFHVSMSPPSSEIDKLNAGDRRAVCTSARFVSAVLTKGLFWASALTDTFAVISIPPTDTLLAWTKHPTVLSPGFHLPTSLSEFHALSLPSSFSLPPLPLMTVAGTTLALTGAYLRYAAYHALGRFYACPNRGTGPCHARGHAHALITTGPYAIIRHPGYAGLLSCTAGLVLLQLDAVKAGERASSGMMRMVAIACAILATVGALRRIREEERALRTRFKGEWETWARNVPYKLVPGVY